MTRRAIVVGHADADGHIITEQVRRNLARIPGWEVDTYVDPKITKDHTAWMKLGAVDVCDGYDFVFFVDIMFAPSSFVFEAAALMGYVNERPAQRFYVVDHHPLPLGRLVADNLRTVYREDVIDCAIGPPSAMMVTAALCEHQPTRAKKTHEEVERVAGMRRAAAYGGPLAGEKLLALVRADKWEEIAALGREPASANPMPRGNRPKDVPFSNALKHLNELADELLKGAFGAHPKRQTKQKQGGTTVAYEADSTHKTEASRRMVNATQPTPNPRDLEAIVTLLELAAIELTRTPDTTFTTQELLDRAQEIGGPSIELRESDVKIVLTKAGFLKKAPGGRLQLK